jgi:hypothetical protein
MIAKIRIRNWPFSTFAKALRSLGNSVRKRDPLLKAPFDAQMSPVITKEIPELPKLSPKRDRVPSSCVVTRPCGDAPIPRRTRDDERRAIHLTTATLVHLVKLAHLLDVTDRRRWIAHGERLEALPVDHLWRVVGRWPLAGQPNRLVDLVSVDDTQIAAVHVPWWAVAPAC